MSYRSSLLGAAAVLAALSAPAFAADCEVTHWWTSGGEAAAVAEFAKAFDATGNKWVDGAIAGSGDTARPIMISRITGGDPPCATQFNPGKDADELIAAGLMRDLTDARHEGRLERASSVRRRSSRAARKDGKVYCVPVNIHSAQWMWTNRHVYEDAGVTAADELGRVRRRRADAEGEGHHAALRRRRAGRSSCCSPTTSMPAHRRHGSLPQGLRGQGRRRSPAVPRCRRSSRRWTRPASWSIRTTIVPQWNDATNLVITGKAGANVMGDWAQGEFQVAKQVAGKDYTCLPGLGVNADRSTPAATSSTSRRSTIRRVTAAQMKLASIDDLEAESRSPST